MFTSMERLASAKARHRIPYIASTHDVAIRRHLDACIIAYEASVALAEKNRDSKSQFIARKMLDGTFTEHGYLPLEDADIEDRFKALTSGKRFLPAHAYYNDVMDPDRRSSSARRIDAFWSAVA